MVRMWGGSLPHSDRYHLPGTGLVLPPVPSASCSEVEREKYKLIKKPYISLSFGSICNLEDILWCNAVAKPVIPCLLKVVEHLTFLTREHRVFPPYFYSCMLFRILGKGTGRV